MRYFLTCLLSAVLYFIHETASMFLITTQAVSNINLFSNHRVNYRRRNHKIDFFPVICFRFRNVYIPTKKEYTKQL
jgi:hypothetical protein